MKTGKITVTHTFSAQDVDAHGIGPMGALSIPTRRVKMLVRRHLRLISKGKASFDKASEALAIAINCGLKVGQPIELEILDPDGQPKKEQFYLVDNFDREVVYKPARLAHYEFKQIPKSKRAQGGSTSPQGDASQSPQAQS